MYFVLILLLHWWFTKPPATRRSTGSRISGRLRHRFKSRICRLKNSNATNWMPFVGATFKQFAPLPLYKPATPSRAQSCFNTSNGPCTAPTAAIFIVATTSKGDTKVREITPAMAPAARNFKFRHVAVCAHAGSGSRYSPLNTVRNATSIERGGLLRRVLLRRLSCSGDDSPRHKLAHSVTVLRSCMAEGTDDLRREAVRTKYVQLARR